MSPPKEDYYSNDVAGAAYFERHRAMDAGEYEDESDYDYDDGPDEEEDEFYDPCNCSDPGCDCSGIKRGIP